MKLKEPKITLSFSEDLKLLGNNIVEADIQVNVKLKHSTNYYKGWFTNICKKEQK